MPTLQLWLLGALDIRYDGRSLSKPPTLKSQSLLAYLAIHRKQPQSRERLATLFWGDQPERKARSSLSTSLWHIRRCFPGQELLLSDPHSVQFDPACGLWLDVEAFESYISAEDPASLEAGLALYRGDFMEGFYDDWILTDRYRLESLFSEALARLMTSYEAGEAYEGALAAALRLADHDPLREDAHGVAMRAYYQLGQRRAALKQYGRCQAILQEELGIEPTSATTELYQVILEGGELPAPERLPLGEGGFFVPVPDVTQRHNLPAQPTPFVGREAELSELARLLADPDVRLLTILGAGGMGKTSLALKAGAAQVGNFEHGVYFVSLAALESVEAIVPTTAEALGFSFYEDVEPQQQLLQYLRHKRMLLIMDNFEHLLARPESGGRDGAGLVSEVLRTAPEVKVLSASRVRLNVQGECLFPLAGMEVPDSEILEVPVPSMLKDPAEYSAVKLFLQSARRICPGFEVERDDLKHISRICRLADGMPLGILLAAGWLEVLTSAEIADQLSDKIEVSLDFLETEMRDIPERQRSMRAVFRHSWNLLSAREQEVFRALSVFRGGFTRQAAQWVTSASLRELRAFLSKSMLQRDPAGRYGMHELLRRYAAEQLAQAPGEESAARDHHCTCYANFLQQREAQLVGRGQKQALVEIGAEIENVRAAWSWAVAKGKVEEIDRSLESLAEFYRVRAWFREGEETFALTAQRLAEVQEESGDPRAKMVLGKVLLHEGRFCHALGLVEKATDLLQESLVVLRDLGARREMAYALNYLGYCVTLRGRDSKPLLQEALAISKGIGDRRGMANPLRGLGWRAIEQGQYQAAKQLLQESLTLCRELGSQEGTAQSLHGLGYVAWLLGEYGEAQQLHEESLALSRGVGDQKEIASALKDLALDGAGLEQYEEAKLLYQESLALYREVGYLRGVADVLSDLSELANVLGEHTEAMRLAQECLIIGRKIDERWLIASAFRVLGDAACEVGDVSGARGYHHQALAEATMLGHSYQFPLNLVGISALMAAEGEKERALELLSLVLHHPMSWQWTKNRAAPLVAELEAELLPGVVAAAWERGRARELAATVAELLDELGRAAGLGSQQS